jgi:hypothetical protein
MMSPDGVIGIPVYRKISYKLFRATLSCDIMFNAAKLAY